MPFENTVENQLTRSIVELIDCDGMQMAQETSSHLITTASRRPHGTHELDVSEIELGVILQIVPVPMIKPLAQQLDWRLSSISLTLRHVQIIHKNDALLTHRGSEYSLATLIQLAHDDILCLLRRGLRGEVDGERLVHLHWEPLHEEVHDVH